MKNKRILVTGGSGFIGNYLLEKLIVSGNEVLSISRNQFSSKPGVSILNSDLSHIEIHYEEIKVFQPDVLIHLSWDGIPDFSVEKSLENVNQSIKLFSLVAKIKSCKKIIVSGSCLEYSQRDGKCMESESGLPTDHFTWAKHSIRNWLEYESKKNHFDYIWLRIFYVYGPGQRSGSLVPTIINSLCIGDEPNIIQPHNLNDYIYVDDVAECISAVTNSKLSSGIYNVGSGSSTKVLEILKILENLINNSQNVSNGFSKKGDEFKRINFWASTTKIYDAIGWKAKTDLKEGLAKTFGHMADQFQTK